MNWTEENTILLLNEFKMINVQSLVLYGIGFALILLLQLKRFAPFAVHKE